MSLVELIVQADERGLAASGVACLDRCLPLLADEGEALRPLWSGIADGEQNWAPRLAAAREALEAAVISDETAVLVRKMLAAAPSEWAAERCAAGRTAAPSWRWGSISSSTWWVTGSSAPLAPAPPARTAAGWSAAVRERPPEPKSSPA